MVRSIADEPLYRKRQLRFDPKGFCQWGLRASNSGVQIAEGARSCYPARSSCTRPGRAQRWLPRRLIVVV
jgi:hypothetical protein